MLQELKLQICKPKAPGSIPGAGHQSPRGPFRTRSNGLYRQEGHVVDGAVEWIRTTDLLITNQLLYQLSYNSVPGVLDVMSPPLYRPGR